MPEFSDAELIAFLDEQLSPERSSRLEKQLRDDEALRQRLVQLRGQNIAGLHTIGAIWRTEGLTCPDRDILDQYLAGKLPASDSDYIRFHITDIECRVCLANLEDLQSQRTPSREHADRRSRVFESSAGHLRGNNFD